MILATSIGTSANIRNI